MKKLLLSLSAFSLALVVNASAPVYEFNKLLDGSGQQDNFTQLAVFPDGHVLTLGHFGSKVDGTEFSFDGEKIAEGAGTTSNTDNRNLLVIKHTAVGNKAWAVYSKNGYIAASDCDASVAPDGSVLLLLKARPDNSRGDMDLRSPMLVDASGAEIEFPDFCYAASWTYSEILVKLNADGFVQWTKLIAFDQHAVPGKDNGTLPGANGEEGALQNNTTDAFLSSAVVADTEGNIYIGGNYTTPMIIGGSKNSLFVLQPRNLDGYNGDVQKRQGGSYLVKLDANGNYIGSAQFAGKGVRDQIDRLVVDGTTLYFVGLAKGNAGEAISLGDKTITFADALDNIMVGAVSTETLKPVFFKAVYGAENTKNTNKFTVADIFKDGDNLYVCGHINGGLKDDAGSVIAESSVAFEQGYALRLSATDGAVLNATCNKSNIGGYHGGFRYGESVYFFGYVLNANTGTFLEEYPATGDFGTPTRHTLVTGGGAPTAAACAFNDKTTRIYTLARGNNAFKMGDVTSEKPTSWGSLLAGHYLITPQDGVTAAEVAQNGFKVVGGNGIVTVTTDADANVAVTNLAGQSVVNKLVKAGSADIALAPGVYLVNDVKVIVK